MKKSIITIFFPATALALWLAACSSNEKLSAVRPPIDNVNVAAQYFDIDPAKGGTVELDNGTRIIVPADAFAGSGGQAVKGKVKLRYREFHTAGDIIASGIPMTYDSAGVKNNFISAGMFELLAADDNGSLQLASGKSVEVQMASFRNDGNFKFYSLDTLTGKWSYEGIAEPVPNERKLKRMKDAGISLRPESPMLAGKDEDVFKFDVDYSAFPELKLFENVLWRYKGADASANPLKQDWIFGEKWRNVSIARVENRVNVYRIDLKSKKRSFSMEVQPTFDEANYAEAMASFEQQVAAYDKMITDRANTDKWLLAQADILRSYKVTSLGLCNWDTINRMVDSGQLNKIDATFAFDGIDPTDEHLSIYLVDETEGSVRACPQTDWNQLVYVPDHKNKIIAVLPNGKTAVFGSDQFGAIGKQDKFTFRMRNVETDIKSVAALDQVLKGA